MAEAWWAAHCNSSSCGASKDAASSDGTSFQVVGNVLIAAKDDANVEEDYAETCF